MTSTDAPPAYRRAAYVLLSLTLVLAILAAWFVHLSRHANYYGADPGHITRAQAHSMARQLHEDDEAGRDAFQSKELDLENRYDTYTLLTLAVSFATLSAGVTCAFITRVGLREIRIMGGLTIIFVAAAITCLSLSVAAGHRVDNALWTGRTPKGISGQDYQDQQWEQQHRYAVALLVTGALSIAAFTSAATGMTARRRQS